MPARAWALWTCGFTGMLGWLTSSGTGGSNGKPETSPSPPSIAERGIDRAVLPGQSSIILEWRIDMLRFILRIFRFAESRARAARGDLSSHC